MNLHKRQVAVLAFFSLLTLVGSNFAHATTVLYMPIPEMRSAAELIVRGTVTQSTSRWSIPQKQASTDITINVSTVYKGNLKSGTFTFTQLGGTIGTFRQEILGQPVFKTGEEILLFLRKNPHMQPNMQPWTVVGLSQGKFNLSPTKSDLASRSLQGMSLTGKPGSTLPADAHKEVFTVQELVGSLPKGR